MNSLRGMGENRNFYGKPNPVNDAYILALGRGTKIKEVSRAFRKKYSQSNCYALKHSAAEETKREKKKKKGLPMEWEKIVANNATDKGLISKIYKQLLQLEHNKK